MFSLQGYLPSQKGFPSPDGELPSALPPVPEKIEVMAYGEQPVNAAMDVLSTLKKQKPVVSDQPLTFEKLGQGYGCVLYRKRFTQPAYRRCRAPARKTPDQHQHHL